MVDAGLVSFCAMAVPKYRPMKDTEQKVSKQHESCKSINPENPWGRCPIKKIQTNIPVHNSDRSRPVPTSE
jgi:hypothetical protein